MNKSKLAKETVDDKTYWFSPNQNVARLTSPTAFLLSIFDEYTIAYKDRSALGGERFVEKFISMGNALTAVIVIDGMIVGTWKRQLKKDGVAVILSMLRKPSTSEKQAIEKAVKNFGTYLGLQPSSVVA